MRKLAFGWVAALLLVFVFACSKTPDTPVGKWVNEKTMSTIEFNADKSGTIHQKTQPDIPPDLQFNWRMLDNHMFEVVVALPGGQPPAMAKGELKSNTLLLGHDTFKKM